jgi:ATP/maltotriose-dependent transcriptional regulator MalT
VEAFQGARDDYYTGINAAAKSVLLGSPEDLAAAKEYAGQVQEIVGSKAAKGDYWATATVAEVLLMQGEFEKAGKMYKAAVRTAGSEKGSHKTTWKQANRLMEAMKVTPDERAFVEKAFGADVKNDGAPTTP